MEQFLKELNPAQYEAVVNITGPSLIIAGAGSGKTRVLTYRVAFLLEQGAKASEILCLTFTNKAAREMKERIGRVVGDEASRFLWMGTFHSIFARILRIESQYLGYPSTYTIYDTLDSKSLIKSILKFGFWANGRIYFWKMFLWTIINKPDLLGEALTLAVYGNHFRRVMIKEMKAV